MRVFFLLFVMLLASVSDVYAYDLPYVGDQQEIEAAYEDTFVYLARDYNLGYVEMVAANPDIDPWLPGEGTKLILPTRHLLPDAPREGLVINLAEMRLYAFSDKDDVPPETFPLGVGRQGLETPTGTTKIVRKVKGPIWFPTPRMREEKPELPEYIGPGPDNPLGAYALYLGWPQYLIHGTNKPFGIGRRVSSGCMRMYPEGIAKLFDLVPVDTPVVVVDQPIKVAWIDDALYLEAHPTKDQANQLEDEGRMEAEPLSDDQKKLIETAAGDLAGDLDWDKVDEMVKKRAGYPQVILKRQDGKATIDAPAAVEEPVEAPEAPLVSEETSVEDQEKLATPDDSLYAED